MVNFRQVTISNADNTDRIELNDFDGYLMTSPTGFGIYRESQYITLGNNKVRTNNIPAFKEITFNVEILGARNTWEVKYAELRDFISKYMRDGFRLYYTPYEETRYIKCDISILDKTEKDRARLPVKMKIQPLSLWLGDVQKQSVSIESEATDIFRFDEREITYMDSYYVGGNWVPIEKTMYSAQFKELENVVDEYNRDYYAITFGGKISNVVELLNAGEETIPLTLRVFGKIVNPYIRLKKYGTGEIMQYVNFPSLTINEGYYLEINSDPTNTFIEQVDRTTGERVDREDFANLESNMYLSLPKGRWILEVVDEEQGGKCFTEIFYANQYYGG